MSVGWRKRFRTCGQRAGALVREFRLGAVESALSSRFHAREPADAGHARNWLGNADRGFATASPAGSTAGRARIDKAKRRLAATDRQNRLGTRRRTVRRPQSFAARPVLGREEEQPEDKWQ